jgi:hypothetical protein
MRRWRRGDGPVYGTQRLIGRRAGLPRLLIIKIAQAFGSSYHVFRKFGECATFGIWFYAELLEWSIKAIDPESMQAK